MPLSLPPPHRPGTPRLTGPGDSEDGGVPKLTNTRASGPRKASRIESPVGAPRPHSHPSQASALSLLLSTSRNNALPARTGGDPVTGGSCPVTITGELVPTPHGGQVSGGPRSVLAGCALLRVLGPPGLQHSPEGTPRASSAEEEACPAHTEPDLGLPSAHSDRWTLVPQPPGGRQQKRSALVSMGQASTSANCPLHPALKFPGWS